MVNSSESQAAIREMMSFFIVDNPMSWQEFSRGCGISPTTVRKFARGSDLKRMAPLFKMLKFMKEYKG